MVRAPAVIARLGAGPLVVFAGAATDNRLTAAERAAGWLQLFEGRTLVSWRTSAGPASRTDVDDRGLNPHGSEGYVLVQKHQAPAARPQTGRR